MGKRYEPPRRPEQPPGIYNDNNPYGYRYNLNHPQIRELYERYKAWKDIKTIPSDEERREFEAYVDKLIDKQKQNE